MPLVALDHVNLRTARLEELRRFYTRALGLAEGPRPGFSFNGAWMYCGKQPVVHLVEVDVLPNPGEDLRLQHFAFSGHGLGELLKRLADAHVEYRIGFVRDFELCQVNVHDPDGNHIHVDFSEAEALALNLA